MTIALLLIAIAYFAVRCNLINRQNALIAKDFEFHFSLGHVKPKYCMRHTKLYRTSKCNECEAER